MAQAAALLAVGGGLMEAGGAIQAGNEANKKAKREAAQLESQANSVQGDAQRQMLQLRREQRLAQSEAIARGAAGGMDTSQVGFAKLYGDIQAQGDYNALTALYNGDVQATGLRNQASATRYEGQLAKKASKIQAISGLMKTGGSAASMSSKYGAGGYSPSTGSAPYSNSSYFPGSNTTVTWNTPKYGGYR